MKNLLSAGWRAFGKLGANARGVALLGGGSYLGWNKISTGKWLGEDNTLSKIGNLADGTLDAANKVVSGANKVMDKVESSAPGMINRTGEALSGGVGGLVGGGQGEGLLGNMFGGVSNLLGGLFNGGTGNLLGLVAAGFMLFGNFGWMGKIGGMLLAALSLGMFSGNQQQVAPQLAQGQQQAVGAQQVSSGGVQSNQSMEEQYNLGGQDDGTKVHLGSGGR